MDADDLILLAAISDYEDGLRLIRRRIRGVGAPIIEVPTNGYITEDISQFYITENASAFYVTET
jgi:hypothetical protein